MAAVAAEPATSVIPALDARSVRKSFRGSEVLKGVSLTAMPGEVMCIIGPSGSGKSTFLRCINHLERIDSGRLLVFGQFIGYRQVGQTLREVRGRHLARQRRDVGQPGCGDCLRLFLRTFHVTRHARVDRPDEQRRDRRTLCRQLGAQTGRHRTRRELGGAVAAHDRHRDQPARGQYIRDCTRPTARQGRRSDTADTPSHVPLWRFADVDAIQLPRECVLVGVELLDEAGEVAAI